MPTRSASVPVIDSLILLRATVGFLGQKQQGNWWDSKFLDATGIRFLESTFPRSAYAAAIRSTSEAACRIHDEALGKMGVFHLYRLPSAIEDSLELRLPTFCSSKEFQLPPTKESALELLGGFALNRISVSQGPIQVGVERKILTKTSIEELSAHYLAAFEQGITCFPYFSCDKRNE